MKRRKPLNPISDKQRERKRICADYCHRHPFCETCQRIFNRSPHATEHPHHILRRTQGGDDSDANLLAVCRECHDVIHNHPLWAVERGYLRRRWNYKEAL